MLDWHRIFKKEAYQSKIAISQKSKQVLTKKLLLFLEKNHKTYCKALKRKVFLDKLPDAIIERKQSATHRLQCFFVAIDILKHETTSSVRERSGCLEYEIIGTDCNGKKVYVHLREELSIKKDRVLFFVSCY